MSWSRKEKGKYDFELYITRGVEFRKLSFSDLEVARDYFVPGLKEAKKNLRARADKIERHNNFFDSKNRAITSDTLTLSLNMMHELKLLFNLLNDEHPTKEKAEDVAVAIILLEVDAEGHLRIRRSFIICVRTLLFTLTFYILMILPAFIGHGGSMMSPTKDLSTLFLRPLPFIIVVCWEIIIGEFIKPMQIQVREEETMLIRIRRIALAMRRKVLSSIAPYLELEAASLAQKKNPMH